MKTIDSYHFVNVRAGNGDKSVAQARKTRQSLRWNSSPQALCLMPDETLSAPNAPLNQSPSRAAQVLTSLAKLVA